MRLDYVGVGGAVVVGVGDDGELETVGIDCVVGVGVGDGRARAVGR